MSRLESPADLVKELEAKAWQSTRHRLTSAGRTPARLEDHVCHRAAKKLEELARGPDGMVPLRVVRETFTRLLNLTYDQRAYSWHEIQHALGELEKDAQL